MKVIKNINNNVSLCLDSTGTEVVAFGKGIGFKRPPYEISLSEIDKTFYGVSEAYAQMVQDIPVEVLNAADRIVDYAKKTLPVTLSPNIVFTLADHINFAIQRAIQQMSFNLPITQDLQHLFEREVQVGRYAVELIRADLRIALPEEESFYIALHIIGAEAREAGARAESNEQHIERIVTLIERDLVVSIDRDEFSYARFVSHMHYLIKRCQDSEDAVQENEGLYESLRALYPDAARSTTHVGTYLEQALGIFLSDEELAYLIMHIVRLCKGKRSGTGTL